MHMGLVHAYAHTIVYFDAKKPVQSYAALHQQIDAYMIRNAVLSAVQGMMLGLCICSQTMKMMLWSNDLQR